MDMAQKIIDACMRRQVGDNMIYLSTKIDNKKLVPVLEVTTEYQAILGGSHHH